MGDIVSELQSYTILDFILFSNSYEFMATHMLCDDKFVEKDMSEVG
jgi:hypothetical protein